MDSLNQKDCYMDDVVTAVQCGLDQQHQVFDGTVRDLKWLLPSLRVETKDFVSVKKFKAGERDWTCVKEFPAWMIDIEYGTLSLQKRKL